MPRGITPNNKVGMVVNNNNHRVEDMAGNKQVDMANKQVDMEVTNTLLDYAST